jgi:hypothetical protein
LVRQLGCQKGRHGFPFTALLAAARRAASAVRRNYWLLLAEGHLTRRLFAGMLAKIAMLPSPAG